MKKIVLVIGVAFVVTALSSCYRHTVCATYLNNDQPQEQIEVEQEGNF